MYIYALAARCTTNFSVGSLGEREERATARWADNRRFQNSHNTKFLYSASRTCAASSTFSSTATHTTRSGLKSFGYTKSRVFQKRYEPILFLRYFSPFVISFLCCRENVHICAHHANELAGTDTYGHVYTALTGRETPA